MPQRRAESFVLAIDIGSSSTRSAIFDQRGRPLPDSQAAQSYSIRYSANGGAELSPFDPAQGGHALHCRELEPLRTVSEKTESSNSRCFWFGFLAWLTRTRFAGPPHHSGLYLGGLALCRRRRAIERNGVRVSRAPTHRVSIARQLLAGQARWLREGQPRLFRRVARWVSPGDWVFRELFHITGSSPSMASGTGLYDRYRNEWDRKTCALCGVDPSALPSWYRPRPRLLAFPILNRPRGFSCLSETEPRAI